MHASPLKKQSQNSRTQNIHIGQGHYVGQPLNGWGCPLNGAAGFHFLGNLSAGKRQAEAFREINVNQTEWMGPIYSDCLWEYHFINVDQQSCTFFLNGCHGNNHMTGSKLKLNSQLYSLWLLVQVDSGYSEAKQCNIKLTNPFCPVLINICNTDGTKTAMRCTGTR